MSRRLEVELTSKRDDGSYTWRAAGARQPKGDLDGSLLYDGATVGDIVRADADFGIDGVIITAVHPPKAKRARPETLEILGSGRDEGGVTTQLVGKRGRGDRGERDKRGGRARGRDDRGKKGRDERRGRARGSDRDRAKGARRGDSHGGDGGRGRRTERKPAPSRPRPKRLRPGRVHRDAVLNDLPEIHQPLARIVLRDGLPGLRKRVEQQNERAREKSEPEIPPKILEAVGERLLPRLRTADWRDNAEAALAGMDEIDVRDIRKVVVAAESGARDEDSRALAQQLRDGLTARVEADHGKWLNELNQLLVDGRTVRALRQSSRPPKAGAPLPPDLVSRLTEAANASMTAETSPERWATVLDAVAYSPVRQQVRPQGIPGTVTDELAKTVKKLASRVPEIASLFEPAEPTPSIVTPTGSEPGQPSAR